MKASIKMSILCISLVYNGISSEFNILNTGEGGIDHFLRNRFYELEKKFNILSEMLISWNRPSYIVYQTNTNGTWQNVIYYEKESKWIFTQYERAIYKVPNTTFEEIKNIATSGSGCITVNDLSIWDFGYGNKKFYIQHDNMKGGISYYSADSIPDSGDVTFTKEDAEPKNVEWNTPRNSSKNDKNEVIEVIKDFKLYSVIGKVKADYYYSSVSIKVGDSIVYNYDSVNKSGDNHGIGGFDSDGRGRIMIIDYKTNSQSISELILVTIPDIYLKNMIK